ncbi:MAG: cofactor-independent phosphoglycerate mutase [Thermoleophilia bacterium]|nr:cofactor-independent phosphoglycerate mutase [Thermoleophilia bacterium]
MPAKYLVIILDGASGWPREEWGGQTSLERAHTPNLNRLAQEGVSGLAYNVPEGMEPSSAVACMSVMGFDPATYYCGRGPIEALALGIELEPGEVAMRCNLVTVLEGRMVSYSAGDIPSNEAGMLVHSLREEVIQDYRDSSGGSRLNLYAGVGFRNILTVKEGQELLATSFTPPHDITGQEVDRFGPKGPGADLVNELTERSKTVLACHPVNKSRISRGLLPATQVWLFWPGMRPGEMPAFADIYGGRKAAVTSGVDLLRGLAMLTGMEIISIPGVTDGVDNDYYAQMAGALDALHRYDVVFVHVEAPDAAAHAGDADAKVRAIEQIDALMLSQVFAWAEKHGPASASATPIHELSVLALCDHPTPLAIRTHVAEPVPFVMWGPKFQANGAREFTEKAARATGLVAAPGWTLMSWLLDGRVRA